MTLDDLFSQDKSAGSCHSGREIRGTVKASTEEEMISPDGEKSGFEREGFDLWENYLIIAF